MFYVYYLHSTAGELLYIGRSLNPIGRKSSFERRTGQSVFLGICQRHSNLEDACKAELAAIAKHRPPYNKYLASSPCRTGKKNSAAHNAAISAKTKGLVRSEETRRRISEANKRWIRKPDTPEVKAKKSAAMTRRFFEYQGQSLSIKQLAEVAGVDTGTMKYRLCRAGWSPERAVSKQTRPIGSH